MCDLYPGVIVIYVVQALQHTSEYKVKNKYIEWCDMYLANLVRRRPKLSVYNDHPPWRKPMGMACIFFAVWIIATLVGCATLGPRLNGVSGPIAWQATDLRIVERQAAGDKRDFYAFTLVLKETHNTAITFTQAEYTISQPGISDTGVSDQQTILWKLQPHGELRHPISFYWYCTEFDCANVDLRPAPWFDVVLMGTDDQGQPVRVEINLYLPHRSSKPKSAHSKASARVSQSAKTTAPTERRDIVPIQIVNNTILVNAVLNDKEYVTLLFDTGASRTIVTPDTAKRLGISPPSTAPKHTAVVLGGQEVAFSFTQLESLRVGETVVEDLQLGVALVFPEAPLVDGVLGGDILQRFTITLNYAMSRLQLHPMTPPLTLPPHPTTRGHTVSVGVVHNRPWVRAKLNAQKEVTLLLDTGASRTLLHPNTAQKASISLMADALQGTTTVFGGRKVTFPLAQLSSIAVGDAAVEELQIGVFLAMPTEQTVGGILGGDFLRHFTVTLDYTNRQLWLISDTVVQR